MNADRETLVRAFRDSTVKRGNGELARPTWDEAERMADVAMAVVGGPEGTAPAGDEAGDWFRDEVDRARERNAALPAGARPVVTRPAEAQRSETAAPSRSGRPDPGEDEARSGEFNGVRSWDGPGWDVEERGGRVHLGLVDHDRRIELTPAMLSAITAAAPSPATTEGADAGAVAEVNRLRRALIEASGLLDKEDPAGAQHRIVRALLDPLFPGSGTVPASEGDDRR